MGCCGGSKATSDDAPDPHTFFFKKRGCTDCLCFIIFFAFWAVIGYITYLSMTVGDPYAVLYGQDYLGNRCGVGTMSDKPAIYYPRLDQDLASQAAIASTMPWRLAFYGLCMSACPNVTTPQACFADPSQCQVYDYGTPAQYGPAGGSPSYYATMASINLVNRCIPNDAASLSQAPDRCAFPQCDGVNYAPCDTEEPTTWVMSFPASLNCKVIYRSGTITQLRPAALSPLTSQIGSNVANMNRIAISIAVARDNILIFGLALPIVLGFLFLVLLRLAAGIITYVMITLIGVAMFLLSCYLWIRAGIIDELMAALQNTTLPSGMNITDDQLAALNNTLAVALGIVSSGTDALAALAPSDLTGAAAAAQNEVPALWLILAAVMSLITLLYVVSMCAARKQIKTAVALVKSGSMIIKDRPQTMFYPFNILVMQVLTLGFFVLLVLFLQTADIDSSHFSGISAGMRASTSFLDQLAWLNNTINTGGVQSLEDIDNNKFYIQVAIYLWILFGFLWTIESFNNISWTAMSGSVSHWYFFREDDTAKTRIPLIRSTYRVIRYHLGSIFFGSFIVALIQLIRILLMALDRWTKKQQDKNLALKLLIKCTQCCMWCLEKTIKFITNYCYIYIALQGAGFCKACFATFSLIVNNPAQLAINTFVRTILSWIQLLGTPIACAWLVNLMLIRQEFPETMAPTVVVAITSYVIAKVFSLVFACVLDTLFVCCIRDKAEYKGKYMPARIYEIYFKKKKDKKSKKGDEEAEGDADAEVEPQK